MAIASGIFFSGSPPTDGIPLQHLAVAPQKICEAQTGQSPSQNPQGHRNLPALSFEHHLQVAGYDVVQNQMDILNRPILSLRRADKDAEMRHLFKPPS